MKTIKIEIAKIIADYTTCPIEFPLLIKKLTNLFKRFAKEKIPKEILYDDSYEPPCYLKGKSVQQIRYIDGFNDCRKKFLDNKK